MIKLFRAAIGGCWIKVKSPVKKDEDYWLHPTNPDATMHVCQFTDVEKYDHCLVFQERRRLTPPR